MRLSSIALSVLLLSPGPLLASAEITPLRPLGNPAEWVTPDDYPANALRNNITGTTNFRLTVSVDGNVADCTITGSSGSEELDARVCELLTQRAKFEPAHDEDGQPLVASYSNRVRWSLPDGFPLMAHSVLVEFDVEPDGSIVNCRSTITPAYKGQTWCDRVKEVYFVDSAVAEKAKQGRRHVVMRESLTIEEPAR